MPLPRGRQKWRYANERLRHDTYRNCRQPSVLLDIRTGRPNHQDQYMITAVYLLLCAAVLAVAEQMERMVEPLPITYGRDNKLAVADGSVPLKYVKGGKP